MKRECLTIIGTAHVSSDSVEEVKNTIYELQPDVVGIELDYGRYDRLMKERAGLVDDEESIHIKQIIKENKVGLFFATTILSYIQNKIGANLDVKPGSEMIAAADAANDLGIKIALLDRDINITLQRTLNNMSFWEKLKFLFSTVTSFFSGDDETEEIDIEELKNEETLEEVMEYFQEVSPGAYHALVQERDAYLANSIRSIEEDKVIAVVGAGHQDGINRYLDNPETIPPISEITNTEKKGGIPWLKIILAMIPILFVVIFFLAFIKGIKIEWNIAEFIIISMIMGFVGSICSGSKIQSALVGGVVAPLTIIHPLLAAGWFSGLTELKYRKVRKKDIKNLNDINSLRDLWNNNIFRVLLVVIGTNLAVSIATLVILPSQVFIPLFFKIF
ncbi:MAG: TraB/GumN family protein [Methanobacteriaceae archaeon]|jgi:pheromone shutdown-related protein TraB|uniref:TraB/GumN family protein n=1 Tax=unclassified Methanobrevibacter TaxID=2638681 RepID=UPI002A179519|nr:TraB/GumN family protein [Methanobacteriaceae archaeon]MDD3409143.1 TraB/GumN family protein [Methanobacteriaceae archaeon]MDD4594094.1 TraB/GumN family protein [Methanobacteriaceae archaeon]